MSKLALATLFFFDTLGAMAQHPDQHPHPHAAPAPELGDGTVGLMVATACLLAVLLYPRLKRALQPKWALPGRSFGSASHSRLPYRRE